MAAVVQELVVHEVILVYLPARGVVLQVALAFFGGHGIARNKGKSYARAP